MQSRIYDKEQKELDLIIAQQMKIEMKIKKKNDKKKRKDKSILQSSPQFQADMSDISITQHNFLQEDNADTTMRRLDLSTLSNINVEDFESIGISGELFKEIRAYYK